MNTNTYQLLAISCEQDGILFERQQPRADLPNKVTEESMGKVQCMGRREMSGNDKRLIWGKGSVKVLEKNI